MDFQFAAVTDCTKSRRGSAAAPQGVELRDDSRRPRVDGSSDGDAVLIEVVHLEGPVRIRLDVWANGGA